MIRVHRTIAETSEDTLRALLIHPLPARHVYARVSACLSFDLGQALQPDKRGENRGATSGTIWDTGVPVPLSKLQRDGPGIHGTMHSGRPGNVLSLGCVVATRVAVCGGKATVGITSVALP
jgi:hypothetical protein